MQGTRSVAGPELAGTTPRKLSLPESNVSSHRLKLPGTTLRKLSLPESNVSSHRLKLPGTTLCKLSLPESNVSWTPQTAAKQSRPPQEMIT